MRRAVAFAFFLALRLSAQSLVDLVTADSASIGKGIAVSTWQHDHPGENEVAPSLENPEYETQGLWCAARQATVELRDGVKVRRLVLFYVPAELPPITGKLDPDLSLRCELESFVYQVDAAADLKKLVLETSQALGAAWGAAEVIAPHDRLRYGWGSAYWDPYFHWQLPWGTAVEALDTKAGRGLVILRGRRLPESAPDITDFHYGASDQPSVAGEAVKLAGVATGPLNSTEAFVNWIRNTRELPAPRRAAALLAADIGMRGFGLLPADRFRLEAIGARFKEIGDDATYAGNWLAEATRLAVTGQAAELIRMDRVETPCSFEGPADWRAPLIEYGEKFLKEAPGSMWAPYVHYILARTYAMRLLLNFKGGDAAANANRGQVDSSAMRSGALGHFAAYLAAKPQGGGSKFAREESFRLVAGLPPYPVHFGCTNE